MKPQTLEMQVILERLEKLEKRNRNLKRAGWLALTAVGALLLIGQAAPEPRAIEAEMNPDKPSFPDNSQINLLLTQTERAFETYELEIKEEQLELGKEGAESAARDRQVLNRVRQYLPKLKAKPQAFNSPAGFLLVIDLDDASRNMAVCMGQAGMDAGLLAAAGNASAGNSKLMFAQSCQGASQLLYTVSETAVSLYENYLFANWDLQQEAVETIGKCNGILNGLQKPGPAK
jgi:hypothetical protein